MEATGTTTASSADAYPAAPWILFGSAWVSLWKVPGRALPPAATGLRYAQWADQALLFTIWASYAPGSTVQYDELAVAVPVRGAGLLAACTVSQIWVSDAVAAEGGCGLWGIPKVVGSFDAPPDDNRGYARHLSEAGRDVAALRFEPGSTWPGRPKLKGFVVQVGEGGPLRTRCSVSGKVAGGRAIWDFPLDGPLAYLHGRQPLFSVQISDMQLACGI
ncbi:MAG: acetoacetate decarboxylase family protein [Pigmentiphaga sp.]|uniref:acetoacetate decarboxylase family protein n=1 Tax=Pigmentiphaga sp. TaxID=1977564 RepID=UPI0029B0930D|nr:acetoacetate decarboxylase family protein [Pigmentiphaga sp.]MDX3906357.1 acetoacetate decarboxylase family protein [Pigmentiphaga sp.]